MAGLNNFLSDTQQTSTTMPAWYDQAQQNIVQQGGQALTNAPSLSQTTAQNAINTLQGPNNPFSQAQGTLQQISSGAANPWIVTPQYSQPQYKEQGAMATGGNYGPSVGMAGNVPEGAVTSQSIGNEGPDYLSSLQATPNQIQAQNQFANQSQPSGYSVAPNPYTAMGGLFAAQQNELNQLMPDYTAPVEAGAIGSGNFGSLRGQTAVDKAKGDAFAKLNAAQMQAALTNQQTGVNAATGLGAVGQQGINAAMNVGQTQMNAPFNNLANYSNLISSMPTPTTTQSQVQYSPLSQIQGIGNVAQGGLNSLRSLYGTQAGKNILDKLGLGSLFSSSTTNTVNPTLPDGTPNPDFIGPIDTNPGDTNPGDTNPGDTNPGDTNPGDINPDNIGP